MASTMANLRITESTWAVFDCRGAVPPAIQSGWKYMQEEWLVRYPFEHADCPELEWYSFSNSYERDYLSQIWIPVAAGCRKEYINRRTGAWIIWHKYL